MHPALKSRRPILALASGLAVLFALVAVAPALAQDQPSSRYRVLVPTKLERQGDVDDDFGEDVSEILRELIDGLDTHAPVDEDDFEDALRRYDLDEDEMDCLTARQLAVQIQAQVVMCAVYRSAGPDDQMAISARFLDSRTGEAFEIDEFTVTQPDEAASHIFRLFEEFANHLRFVGICQQYLGSQQWQNAITNCDRALAINENSESALYMKARALMELAGQGEAAIGVDDTTLVAAEEAGQVEMDTDLLEQSLEVHQRVLELNPVHQDALKTAGIVAAHLDRTQDARDHFNQYLEMNPGAVDVRLTIATDLANAGDAEGALRIAEEGIDDAPDNLTLVEYIGHFALRAAQDVLSEPGADGGEEASARAQPLFEKALDYYLQVFEAQGSDADDTMLRNMIAALTELERTDEAADLGAEIVAAKPDAVPLWSSYASALQRAGRIEEALAALDSLEAKDPEYPNIYARRGQWLLRTDDLEGARAAFERAIEAGQIQSDAAARNVFAYAYNNKYDNGENDLALEFFEVAHEFATEEQTRAMIHFWTGFILLQRGRQVQEPSTAESAERALPIFQRALEHLQQGAAWTETQPSINLQEYIGNANQFIDIQEALMRRGR